MNENKTQENGGLTYRHTPEMGKIYGGKLEEIEEKAQYLLNFLVSEAIKKFGILNPEAALYLFECLQDSITEIAFGEKEKFTRDSLQTMIIIIEVNRRAFFILLHGWHSYKENCILMEKKRIEKERTLH